MYKYIFSLIILAVPFLHTQNPALDIAGNDITFYWSFDNDSAAPDMSEIALEPQITGSPEFGGGRYGNALFLGDGTGKGVRVNYIGEGSIVKASGGAVVFWVCPKKWVKKDAPQRAYLIFVNIDGTPGACMIQRMGFCSDPAKKRLDRFTAGFVNFKDMKASVQQGIDTLVWMDDVWHLIIISWDSASYHVAVDGNAFQSRQFSRSLTDDDFVSSKRRQIFFGGAALADEFTSGETTLIDEVIIYKRPLTQSEADLIWKRSAK